jgi:hypothetical protein
MEILFCLSFILVTLTLISFHIFHKDLRETFEEEPLLISLVYLLILIGSPLVIFILPVVLIGSGIILAFVFFFHRMPKYYIKIEKSE